MADRAGPSGELKRLVAELADGTLTDDQGRRLAELLRQDTHARAYYLDYMALLTSLQWEYATAASMSGDAMPAGVGPPPREAGVDPGPRPPAPGVPRGARPMHRPWPRRTIAAAACALVLLVAGFAAWRRPVVAPPRPQPVAGPEDRDRPDIAAGPATGPSPRERGDAAVASLVDARNVAWAEGQPPIAVGTRLGPGEIRCTSGTLKLVFDSGALVALEGPADLRVLSGMRIRAIRGRITARVDDRAKGFAIETPSTVVVDRGTEFGVKVDDSGQTDVVVFEGLVDLSRPGPSAGDAAIRQLVQGEAMRVGREGALSRIVAVRRRPGDDAWSTGPSSDRGAVIRSVRDNIRGLDSPKYYQVVRRGLDDDAPAYVDRHYHWCGLDPGGLPGFLRGADYLMTFNDDKLTMDLQITVEVARAATLYVFIDDREETPPWLTEQFADTGVDIGLDIGPNTGRKVRFFTFSVWKRALGEGESIGLGAMRGGANRGMYGIAAVDRP